MGIVTWVLVGIALGAIAGFIAGRKNTVLNIVVGLAGAGLAGWIATLFEIGSFSAFSILNLLISAGGAVVLLLLLTLIMRSREA